jgi:hypothetical protein
LRLPKHAPNAWSIVAAAVALTLVPGCAAWQTASEEHRFAAADRYEVIQRERLDRGYVVVLPGVCGSGCVERGIVEGIRRANVDAAIELYDWTDGRGGRSHNLQAEADNRAQAQEIARRIALYQHYCPGRPVHLVGYSGGGAMVVFTLEALPAGCDVTSATLLGAVLSPQYDLSAALPRSRRGIRNFHSPLDAGALMVSTLILGTMDGHRTWSAGAVGFEPPPNQTAEQRALYDARLIQRPYNARMLQVGHIGGHYGWASPWFVARWVAPEMHETALAPQMAAAAR